MLYYVDTIYNNFAQQGAMNDKLLVESFKYAIKQGILPDIFNDMTKSRFKILNKLNQNTIFGSGTIAKMAQIYTSKCKIYIYKKKITIDDITALNKSEVTDAFADIMEELIDKATIDVQNTLRNSSVRATGNGSYESGNMFGI